MLLALTNLRTGFATLDPNTFGNASVGEEGILSSGNLTFTVTQVNQDPMSAVTTRAIVRKSYWESVATFSAGTESVCGGIWASDNGVDTPSHTKCSNAFPGGVAQLGVSSPFYGDGTYYRNNVLLGTILGGVASGSFMGHRFDPNTGQYDITLDGSTYITVFTINDLGTPTFWAACGCFRNTSSITFNFGASAFHFSVPVGFAAGVY